MPATGIRRPGLYALIAGVVGIGGLVAVGIGYSIMQAEGRETSLSASLIGIGLFAAIMGLAFLPVFVIGLTTYRSIARGENAIARWTLTADEVNSFREADARRTALGLDYHSDYTAPEVSPPGGLSVIFVPNAVMIGDIHYGLTVTGLQRFDAVQMLMQGMLAIEFRLRYTMARGATVQRFSTETILLRVPVARTALADAERVLAHYERVLRREIIVNPGFYPLRIRIGLWAAAIFGTLSATGYTFWSPATSLENPIPEILMAGGAIFALGGLILAFAAWVQWRRQRGVG